MKDYYLLVADVVTGSITLLSFVLCLINVYLFKRLKRPFKALSLYVILCFLFDCTNTVLVYLGYPNIGLLPLFNCVELVLLLLFLEVIHPYTWKSKCALILIGVSINSYELVYYLYTHDYIINKGRVFNALLFLVLLLNVLAKDLKEVKYLVLIYTLIVYFTICFIQFFLLDFLINIPDNSIFITWILYALAGGILYLISTYSLWKDTKI